MTYIVLQFKWRLRISHAQGSCGHLISNTHYIAALVIVDTLSAIEPWQEDLFEELAMGNKHDLVINHFLFDTHIPQDHFTGINSIA